MSVLLRQALSLAKDSNPRASRRKLSPLARAPHSARALLKPCPGQACLGRMSFMSLKSPKWGRAALSVRTLDDLLENAVLKKAWVKLHLDKFFSLHGI